MNNSIGIDLGGTIVKVGLIRCGKIVRFSTFETHSRIGLAVNLPYIEEAIDNMLRAEGITASQLLGIGLAFPGIVNPIDKTVISTNDKYDDACKIILEQWVTSRWNVPFCIDNDARMAVIGEWMYGAAKGYRNVVMMTIGTGIGTGVVIDGMVLYGGHFQAGSLGGHLIVDYKSRRCTCGNIGCVEALSSSAFLPSIVRDNESVSAQFKASADGYDFKQIFDMANQGIEDAVIIRNECMDVWSSGIINYIHAYDPEIIVLSGGIMQSKDIIIPYLQQRVDSLAWCPSAKVKIVASELDNAAILGVEYLINKKQKNEKVLEQTIQL